jgi:hypothetical protein
MSHTPDIQEGIKEDEKQQLTDNCIVDKEGPEKADKISHREEPNSIDTAFEYVEQWKATFADARLFKRWHDLAIFRFNNTRIRRFHKPKF